MYRLVLGVTGASGVPLALTLLRTVKELANSPAEKHTQAHVQENLNEVGYEARAELTGTTPPSLLVPQIAQQKKPFSFIVPSIEMHLVFSETAKDVIVQEDASMYEEFLRLADVVHDSADFSAPPSSGSWLHQGMIICPCSMSSLASIATGVGTNLIHRAADVTLKEKRPLLIVPRETPLNRIHLTNMLTLKDAGAIIMPFTPAFYTKPQTIQDMLDQMAGRMLDQLGIPNMLAKRWTED